MLPESQERTLTNYWASHQEFHEDDWHSGSSLPSKNFGDSKFTGTEVSVAAYLTKNFQARWRWKVIIDLDEELDNFNQIYNSDDYYDRLKRRTDPLIERQRQQQILYSKAPHYYSARKSVITSNFVVNLVDDQNNFLCVSHQDEFHLMIHEKLPEIHLEKYCFFKVNFYHSGRLANYFSLESTQLNSRKLNKYESHFLAVDFARIYMKKINKNLALSGKDGTILWKFEVKNLVNLTTLDLIPWNYLSSPPCLEDISVLNPEKISTYEKNSRKIINLVANDQPAFENFASLSDSEPVPQKSKTTTPKIKECSRKNKPCHDGFICRRGTCYAREKSRRSRKSKNLEECRHLGRSKGRGRSRKLRKKCRRMRLRSGSPTSKSPTKSVSRV